MTREKIRKSIKEAIKKSQERKILPFFQIPGFSVQRPEKMHGDFSVDISFKISKIVKKSPLNIAQVIKNNLPEKFEKLFKKIEIVKPGYINFFLKDETILEDFLFIVRRNGKIYNAKNKKLVIDYSSPNIAKPFGIGHLRSTIIGQSIYNIYNFLGWKCISDNHLGDWGTQFGKLIYQIEKDELKGKKGKEKDVILKKLTIEKLEKLYVKFHKEAEKRPEMEKRAREWFKKLEEGNKEAKKIWKACRDISLKEFNKIYKILGITIDYTLGESFYQKMSEEVIEETIKRKVAVRSQGALVIKYPKGEFPPAILLKSDGATTYFTRDLATIKYRLKKWKPDLIVYEVGTEQSLYFKQLFSAVELLGWAKKEKFVHVAHGLIHLEYGKLSTRRGKIIHLEDVLEEAVERAKKIIESSKTSKSLSKKEKEKIARDVGIGAIKYNDLSQEPKKDIIFNWSRILNLKGDSGAYLQYTACRCKSLLEKSGQKKFYLKNKGNIDLLDAEREIIKEIITFPEIIREAADKFSPNLVARFASKLAKNYNHFYDTLPILKASSKKKDLRLFISFATLKFLKISLGILGIKIPKKM